MYKLFVTYSFPDKEKRDGFYECVCEDKIAKACLKEEGCARYEYELPDDDCLLYLHEEWESVKHQQEHMKQPTISFLKGYKMRFKAETNIDVVSNDEENDAADKLMDIIVSRRSTRAFKKDMVPDEKLEKIIEAGRFAASGCNVQNAHFIVVKNQDVLDTLKNIVQEEYAKMELSEDMSTSMHHSVTASKEGNYVFHYNTPVLIIVANRVDNPNNIADTAIAIDNMMLEANALDLGTCWINQLRWLQDNERVAGYVRELGMTADEKVYGSMAVGYPNTQDGMPERKPIERFGNTVTIVK